MYRQLCFVVSFTFLFAAPLRAENTGPITSSTNPAICDQGAFVTSVKCSGTHCAAIEITCDRFTNTTGRVRWTPMFSEESFSAATPSMSCPDGFYIAGLVCRNNNCDDMALYCAEAVNVPVGACKLNDPISSSDAQPFSGPAGANGIPIAKSMSCLGPQCDKLQFEVCMARAEPPGTDCMKSTPKFGLSSGVDPTAHPYTCMQRPIGTDSNGYHWYVQVISGAHRRIVNAPAPTPCNMFGRPVPCDTNALRVCAAKLDGAGNLVPQSQVRVPANCGSGKTGGNGCGVCGMTVHGEHPVEAIQ